MFFTPRVYVLFTSRWLSPYFVPSPAHLWHRDGADSWSQPLYYCIPGFPVHWPSTGKQGPSVKELVHRARFQVATGDYILWQSHRADRKESKKSRDLPAAVQQVRILPQPPHQEEGFNTTSYQTGCRSWVWEVSSVKLVLKNSESRDVM